MLAEEESRGEQDERRRHVEAIKRGAKSAPDGRAIYCPGLWSCRVAAGLTQRELAEALGGSQNTIQKLEACERGALMSTVRKLCEVLGVEPVDILTEKPQHDDLNHPDVNESDEETD